MRPPSTLSLCLLAAATLLLLAHEPYGRVDAHAVSSLFEHDSPLSYFAGSLSITSSPSSPSSPTSPSSPSSPSSSSSSSPSPSHYTTSGDGPVMAVIVVGAVALFAVVLVIIGVIWLSSRSMGFDKYSKKAASLTPYADVPSPY